MDRSPDGQAAATYREKVILAAWPGDRSANDDRPLTEVEETSNETGAMATGLSEEKMVGLIMILIQG